MNKIKKFSALALLASLAFTGCIQETVPTRVVTAESVASSPTAVEAMVNAIAVTETLQMTIYSSHFDFGMPAIMIANDTAIGDVVTAAGDTGSNYDWFDYWGAGYSLNSTGIAPFTWYSYYGFIKSCLITFKACPNFCSSFSYFPLPKYSIIKNLFGSSPSE